MYSDHDFGGAHERQRISSGPPPSKTRKASSCSKYSALRLCPHPPVHVKLIVCPKTLCCTCLAHSPEGEAVSPMSRGKQRRSRSVLHLVQYAYFGSPPSRTLQAKHSMACPRYRIFSSISA